MSIRVGLIGFGLSGRIFHAPFVKNDPDMTLTYVCSSKVDEVKQLFPDVTLVSTVEAILTATDVDLVVITAPNHLHYSLAQAALSAGKHVLLEKPSVTKLADIENLYLLAAKQQRLLCVYQNRRFDGDFKHLSRLIKSETLGSLRYLESRFDRFRPNTQARWREQPGEGTGIFWDLGPHLLDQVLVLFGPPEWVQASFSILRDNSTTTDGFEVEFGYADKRIRMASNPFEAGEMKRFKACFTAGSWHCVGLDPQEAALRSGQMPWMADYASQDTQHAVQYHSQVDTTIETRPEQIGSGYYQAFYRQLALAIKGEAGLPVTAQSACELIYTLTLAEQSAKTGRRLNWDYTAIEYTTG